MMIILVLVLVSAVQMVSADSIADHVVISEVEIFDSEWVELYNPTSNDVDMSSWYWCYFTSSNNWDTPSNKKAFSECSEDLIMESHTFYLMRIDGTVSGEDWDTGYSGEPSILSNGQGSVAIFYSDVFSEGNRVDAVAWSSVSHVKEGDETGVPSSGESLQRKVNDSIDYDGVHGPAWDTDNNSVDFFIDTPDPMSSSADPVPPVPELSTLILFSAGLLILAGYAYMDRRNK
jgi:hypothetical protein